MLQTPIHTAPLERVNGRVRVGVERRRGASRLADLYQAGSAKALLPKVPGEIPHITVINTAGGLTGGDRYRVQLSVGAGSAAVAATQTAERIYRSAGGQAETEISLSVGAGGSLAWLAQETILFEGARLSRRIEADVGPGGRLLIVEPLVLGRLAMGEAPETLDLADRWRIRRDGTLLHAEATRLTGPISARRGAAALGDATALATVLYVAEDAEDRLDRVRRTLGPRAGASAWGGRLVVRLMHTDPHALRQALLTLMPTLYDGALPRVWTM